MSNESKKINFSEAKQRQTILTGLVRTANQDIPNNEDNIVVDCEGNKVVIPSSEIELPPYSKTLVSLVGINVDFIIIEYVEELNLIFGSMKMAGEKRRKPILDKLYNGEILEGTITHIVSHGAYVNINGVSGLLKNSNFSTDGTPIASIYNEFEKIRVKYLKTSSNGNIIFQPETVYTGSNSLSFDDFYREQVCLGKCIKAYPDKVFIRIASGIDCLCPFPARFANLKEQEMVRVKITKIIPEKQRIRGVVIGILGY